MTAPRAILVTSALPYANNSLHIGHMLEYVQTDIWVRFQRLRGHRCYYVCASDAHGTPTMLRAEEQGVSPEALIDAVSIDHKRDFDTYRISVDNYVTTHTAENRELTELIYTRLKDAGHIARRTIRQAYDEEKQMFLPDRYVRGTCPVCKAPDQSGDNCEVCSATYSPLELEDAVSVVSGSRPTVRNSEHLFFRLEHFEQELREWVPNHVDASLARKLNEWFEAGLKDWDISRDAPYFGFAIPGEQNKFFYVWFDAPIGYMGSFRNFCDREGVDFDQYWGADSTAELYHFIGKDIVYFHTLFWPSVLSGAGFRKPSGVFAHGFLTIDGQKMSKSRGTFITASSFAEHVDPDYLRYYFAAKLGPNPEDIDLNLSDLVAKVNSDLVGKLVNIPSRCAGFLHRLNSGRLGATLEEPAMFERFRAAADDIASAYETRNFSRAVRQIMALADEANRYIDTRKPWLAAKDPANHQQVVAVCTLGINLFRTLMIYLQPVLPDVAERARRFLNDAPWSWQDAGAAVLDRDIAGYQALLQRLDPAVPGRLVSSSPARSKQNATPTTEVTMTEQGQVKAGSGAAAKPDDEPAAQIDINDFAKVDLRVARIVKASHVEGADKLLQVELDVGEFGARTVFAGVRSAYDPDTLTGRHVILVANLKPRKMRFGTSEGMLLAAGGDGGIFLLSPDDGARPGMKVT